MIQERHVKHFVEWDQIDVRVNGDRINDLVRAFRVPPIEQLHLHFQNGSLRVIGSVRKFVSVPFEIEIDEIRASGKVIRIPLRSASAFGAIPIPQFLFGLVRSRLPGAVRYEDPATLVVALDRFLPTFVDAEVQKIWIIDGGLAVTLGRGGADLGPSTPEDNHGRENQRSDRTAR
jgi:hypothetical protein